jgi:hypothetical protein
MVRRRIMGALRNYARRRMGSELKKSKRAKERVNPLKNHL